MKNETRKHDQLESSLLASLKWCRLNERSTVLYKSWWENILNFFLKKEDGIFLQRCNFDLKLLCLISLPPFYIKGVSQTLHHHLSLLRVPKEVRVRVPKKFFYKQFGTMPAFYKIENIFSIKNFATWVLFI